ncbi:hypothetical protein GCM10022205_56080 [Spinactinospora alkalitolerans]
MFGTDPAAEHLAALLRRQREELRGRTATIGASAVVHAVEETTWIGMRVAVPACRATADPMRLRPSDRPVTCQRCRRRTAPRRSGGVPAGQLALDTGSP